MKRLLVIPFPGNEAMAGKLALAAEGEIGTLEMRNFPDGETYLRFPEKIGDRSVALVATLADPNPKFLPLLFAAATAKALGAAKIGLIAPYLCYMRQDKSFHAGEAVTSRHFAKLISQNFDWLLTLDPHLHRYKNLREIYSIQAQAMHAAPLLGHWLKAHVEKPFLIGPDAESAEWLSGVAQSCGAPYAVLAKERMGDREVKVSVPKSLSLGGAMPVLIDDVISTGNTLRAALGAIAPLSERPPVILAVHGLFAENADEKLKRLGARLVTTDSIAHWSNGIEIAGLLGPAAMRLARLGNVVKASG